MTEYPVIPGGTYKWTRDATANDSDKSFTVPTGKMWEIVSIQATLVTTATVGNRFLIMQVTNSTPATVFQPGYTAAITASKAGTALWAQGTTAGTGALARLDTGGGSDVSLREGIPPLIIPAGYIIRVADSAAVDAAADDLTVALHYIEYEA